MLEKPDLPDEILLAGVEREFGVRAASLEFLPLGADRHTAVYRLVDGGGAAYFLKLRLDEFDETSVAVPRFLSEHGVANVIAPYRTRTGRLWAGLSAPVGPARLILYPYIAGRDGYEVDLTDRQWVEFGAAVGRIHALALPPALQRQVRVEDYSPRWAARLGGFLGRLETCAGADPLAQQCAAFLAAQRPRILDLLARTGTYAQVLRALPPPTVLCHSDLHAGNLLIDATGRLYIVDWDAPILAPRECDLMYAGGGQFPAARSPAEEERLFYQGYGAVEIDRRALAYYRCARIVADLAVECELIFASAASAADRAREFRYMQSNFAPGGVLDIACR